MNFFYCQGSWHLIAHFIPWLKSDFRCTNDICAADKSSISARMSQLNAGNGPMFFYCFSKKGKTCDEFVLVCPQAAGYHWNRDCVIHKDKSGTAICRLGISFDLTVGYGSVRISKISSHRVANNSVFQDNTANSSFLK